MIGLFPHGIMVCGQAKTKWVGLLDPSRLPIETGEAPSMDSALTVTLSDPKSINIIQNYSLTGCLTQRCAPTLVIV